MHYRLEFILLLVVVVFTQLNCTMNTLPRNMSLKAFDPHRPDFECKHEADYVPPIDPEAEQWLQQGLALTSQLLWPDQRDYKKAVELWTKAAERKHWKAMLDLANAYAHGEGVLRDTEHAVQIVEAAMTLGIPSAYDLMGIYHMEGLGVIQDASRAFAFWELAADMGSPSAMAYLGKKLDATYDSPRDGFWGNREVALKMLECSFAQGNAQGAFQLGVTLDITDHDYPRALRVFHEGVKFGSAESAAYLGGSLREGEPLAGGMADVSRGDRYSALADALRRDPDLRLPNLDKVLPLPPADLPKWDGNKQTLIDAAKPVVPVPPPPPKPAPSAASQRTGRAHIPDGYVLPDKPQQSVPAQYETASAPATGYWLARLLHPRTERHAQWDAAQVPLHYKEGELFDRTRPGLQYEDGRILFHYLGEPVLLVIPPPMPNPRVVQGIAREAALPDRAVQCPGNRRCPTTGIWQASVPEDLATAAVFNQWHRQTYVEKGQSFPDPRESYLDIRPSQVTWLWWDQANEIRHGEVTHIST